MTLLYGNCEWTSLGFVDFAFTAGGLTNDYKTAYEFGSVGVEISKKYDNFSAKSVALFLFAAGPNLWVRHLRTTVELEHLAWRMFITCHVITNFFF